MYIENCEIDHSACCIDPKPQTTSPGWWNANRRPCVESAFIMRSFISSVQENFSGIFASYFRVVDWFSCFLQIDLKIIIFQILIFLVFPQRILSYSYAPGLRINSIVLVSGMVSAAAISSKSDKLLYFKHFHESANSVCCKKLNWFSHCFHFTEIHC